MQGLGFFIGKNVFIRTLTYHYTGLVVAVEGDFLILRNVAWIADSGRFSECFVTEGVLAEVEVMPDGVAVCARNIVDIAPWSLPLPSATK